MGYPAPCMPHHLLPAVIYALAGVRMLLGVAPFVAASPTSRLLSFPAAQDSPVARLLGRFFGVRDIALGVLVIHALPDPAQLHYAVVFNACYDAGDTVAIVIPLVRREGIDRAALSCLGCALTGLLAWLAVLWLLL